MEPGTCHTHLSVEKNKGGGEGWGKRMIKRVNEERGRQETLYEAQGDDANKPDRA